MDLEEKIMIGFFIVVFVLLGFAIFGTYSNKNKCIAKGGVVIEGYMSQNCWKDGGYINF